MLRGACVQKIGIWTALLILLVATLSGGAQANVSSKTLGTWQAVDPGLQDPVTLRLEPDDRFEDYLFRITPSGGTDTALGLLDVKNSHGDLICRGIVSHQGVLNVNRNCDDLRPFHTYTLTWVTDQSGNQLGLYGSRPLV